MYIEHSIVNWNVLNSSFKSKTFTVLRNEEEIYQRFDNFIRNFPLERSSLEHLKNFQHNFLIRYFIPFKICKLRELAITALEKFNLNCILVFISLRALFFFLLWCTIVPLRKFKISLQKFSKIFIILKYF